MIQMGCVNIIFDTSTKGHHMEYIHHLYMMALSHSENQYIFVIPEDFNLKKGQFDWPFSHHIKFDFFSNGLIDDDDKKSSLLKRAYDKTILLRKYIRKYRANKVFLISLIGFIPFLPLLVSRKTKVLGIIYKIYLYEWNSYSALRKLVEVLKYQIISRSKCIDTVFILNDSSAASKLNQLYHTSKFQFLVDPYNQSTYLPRSLREDLGIPSHQKVFLHFGALNSRKGTLTFLQAISLVPKVELDQLTFIIAGQVFDEIKEQFYDLVGQLKARTHLIVYDTYSSQVFLSDLIATCDYVVIPYGITANSSGLIAHAANNHKPVIGPASGLIGKLIRKYQLGVRLDEITAPRLAEAMVNARLYHTDSKYGQVATIERFQQQISHLF